MRLRPSYRRATAVCLGAGAAVLVAASASTASEPGTPIREHASEVQRLNLDLPVKSARFGRFARTVLRPEATVGYMPTAKGKVLRFRDAPGDAGYVGVSAPVGPHTRIGGIADLNLTQQFLRRAGARSLISVDSASGQSVQAGVFRTAQGQFRWALWHRTAAGGRQALVVSPARAGIGRWTRVALSTVWGRAGAKALLRVDGRLVAVGKKQNLGRVRAQRVTFGLGRTGSRSETGTLLMRSASVRAAVGVAGAGGGGGGGGAAPGQPATPASPPSVLPGREIYRADFETGNLSQWEGNQSVAADRIRAVTSPVRQGSYAGRFEVRQGDNPVDANDRAELTIDTDESEGDEYWYGWSTMVDSSVPATQSFQVLMQWHSSTSRRPPVTFFAQGNEMVLWIHPHSGPQNQINFTRAWHGPLPRNVWQDIVMHVKWSGSDSVGFIELWVNGVRQTFDNGTQRRYIRTIVPGGTNYLKMGYYRDAGIQPTAVVWHDNFRMSQP